MNRSDSYDENNIPPDDGPIEYREAHSPFQTLIDSQRKRYSLSERELAEKIGVSQSTLWIWLHNPNGFPDPKSFNSEHVRRLGEVLKISESKIKAALDASHHIFTLTETRMPPEAFDAFGSFIEILENDNRQTVSKSYVLHLAKNLYRGAKVTLLCLAASILLASGAKADEPQTLIATNGHRFEKARVTEVTPISITIVHSCGVARMPLSEFPADVQKKYGYDQANAAAWLAEQQRQQWIAEDAKRRADAEARVRAYRMYQAVEAQLQEQIRAEELAPYLREKALKDALKAKYLSGR
jgi:transcriptional regulator with XRE-family HTH domain